jgi:hypothetical protein
MYRNSYASARQWAYAGAETGASSSGGGATGAFDITGWEEAEGAIRVVTCNTRESLFETSVTNATSPALLDGEKASPLFTAATTVQSSSDWPDAGWAASASSVASSLHAWHAFDDTSDTLWNTGNTTFLANGAGSTGNEWIAMTYPYLVQMRRFTMHSANFNAHPKDMLLEGSDDGTSFTTVRSYTGLPNTHSTDTPFALLSPSAFFRVWRLRITRIYHTSNASMAIRRIRFYTGWAPSDVSIAAVVPVVASPPTSFDIHLKGSNGAAVDEREAPANAVWAFNIILTQDGQLVNLGRYSFYKFDDTPIVTKDLVVEFTPVGGTGGGLEA